MDAGQGIYLHIPFCKQACNYCNFHFSTSMRGRPQILKALQREIELRAEEWLRLPVKTIYLGGGTPSLLQPQELDMLFASLEANQPLQQLEEITLEANPDDLDRVTIYQLASSPVNRLSIGIQSFHEADLQFMQRAHSAEEALQSLTLVRAADFNNLSIDLIYGSPTTSLIMWEENLQRAIDLGIPHISAYALTVEPRTALAHQIKTGQSPPVDEGKAAEQFAVLVEKLTAAGYEQYEISNFSLPGYYSQHNSSYWRGLPYIGIGPSAHSFDGQQERRWNVANNARYQQLVLSLKQPEDYYQLQGLYTTEQLSKADRYNERVMTSLRTSHGLDFQALKAEFGSDFSDYFEQQVLEHLQQGQLILDEDQHYRLSTHARFLADGIAAQAFWV
ncbi:MAG: radical SAM family heme chaperone HemW [Bacteroidota bacterium]